MNDETRNLVKLLLVPGLGQTLVGRCLEQFGSATQTLGATSKMLASIQGISSQGASKILQTMTSQAHEAMVTAELDTAAEHDVQLLVKGTPDYPKLLQYIPDAPLILWVRGQIQAEDALAIGIVGARRCSHYGREQADRFGFQCAQAGLAIVSGGAYGIDVASHRGAIKAGGRTIAVLGSGLANLYPKEHIELFDQIAQQGALVSEFPMSTPPIAENFPRRNRIISGLSLGVLVIEAALRSGALITARLCVEEHGRELMAVPGRVDAQTSVGCHKMIREGWAKLVTNCADVLDSLGEAGQLLKEGVSQHDEPFPQEQQTPQATVLPAASNEQTLILQHLKEPATLDELVTHTGLPAQALQASLTMLELRGSIRRRGGLFELKSSR